MLSQFFFSLLTTRCYIYSRLLKSIWIRKYSVRLNFSFCCDNCDVIVSEISLTRNFCTQSPNEVHLRSRSMWRSRGGMGEIEKIRIPSIAHGARRSHAERCFQKLDDAEDTLPIWISMQLCKTWRPSIRGFRGLSAGIP